MIDCKYFFWTVAVLLALNIAVAQDAPPVPCSETADCQTFSNSSKDARCEGGFCTCLNATSSTRENCTLVNATISQDPQRTESNAGYIGKVCNQPSDCKIQKHVVCDTNRKQCDCEKNHVPFTDRLRCVPVMQYSQTGCEIDQQCTSPGSASNLTCVNGTCLCPEDQFYDTSSGCWKKTPFGSPCNESTECAHVGGAVCDDGKLCSCPKDKVIDASMKSCLSVASKYNDACVESIQCTEILGEKGVCKDEHCRCHEHYYHNSASNKCHRNSELGDSCKTDAECSYEKFEILPFSRRCVNETCACAPAFHQQGKKCIAKPEGDARGAANRLDQVGLTMLGATMPVVLSLFL